MSHTLSFQGYLLNKQIIHRNLFLYDVAMFVLLLFLSVSVPYLLLFSAQRYKKIPISANYSRISDWLCNRNTLEYIGVWEQMYNPNFNYGEFAIIKSNAVLNNFKISVKELVQRTNCIGITSKAGRYGGTYAHKDIAFHFGMYIVFSQRQTIPCRMVR